MNITQEKESDFNFDELFFSRTDNRGVIISGNSVFRRVSKYDWNEVLEKPHRVIRHPSMPRGVFYLFWEKLLKREPVGAYVVNKAKDSSYYWVFALGVPIEGGYLSIRLKPSSSIFDLAKAKYLELSKEEKNKKLSPKDSSEALMETIKGLGFRCYSHFMTEALTRELECRQEVLMKPPLAIITQLREVLKLSHQLQEKSQSIFSVYKASSFTPLNLEILAARIGKEANALAIISTQYDGVSKQIQEEIKSFTRAGRLVQEKVEECQYDICNSILQKEMFRYFECENEQTPIDKVTEMKLLEKLNLSGLSASKRRLKEVETEFSKFRSISSEVKKLASTLDIISINGKIEVARAKKHSEELLGLMNDLVTLKNSLKYQISEVEKIGMSLVANVSEMEAALEVF